MDHTSPYDTNNERAIAEDELLSLGGCVLNLAGLYGGKRHPKHWIPKVAKSKEQVKGKTTLHLIHGRDVSRAIIAAHRSLVEGDGKTGGKRWMLTDLRVYDWWDLIQTWGPQAREKAAENEVGGRKEGMDGAEGLEYEKWVGELMEEEGVRALPRSVDGLGRRLDSRAFWAAVESWPAEGRVS